MQNVRNTACKYKAIELNEDFFAARREKHSPQRTEQEKACIYVFDVPIERKLFFKATLLKPEVPYSLLVIHFLKS